MPSLSCPKCRIALPEVAVPTPSTAGCSACGAVWQVFPLPSLFRPGPTARSGERILSDAEASCFQHAQKKATAHCQGCGRFLCALCEVELGREVICPACFELRKRRPEKTRLLDRKTRWDQVALSVSLGAMLMYPFLFIAVPVAFTIIFWQCRKPQSLVYKVGFNFFVATLVTIAATLELALIVYGVLNVMSS